MKKSMLKPVLFSAATVASLAGVAMSVITVPQAPSPRLTGIDVAVSAVAATTAGGKAFTVFANGGTAASGLAADEMAISVSTTSCNVQPTNAAPYGLADWYAPFDTEAPNVASSAKHPYINTNVYRINADGRLEQLAASWTKHGWYAASTSQTAIAGATGQDACGTGSCPAGSPANNQLGSNCSDTYNAGHNSDRYYMGPRSEISARGTAAAPGYQIQGNYLDAVTNTGGVNDSDSLVTTVAQRTDSARSFVASGTAQSGKLATFKRADVTTAALGSSGVMILEAYYVVNGDVNKLNNFAWRAFTSNYASIATVPTAANFNFSGRHQYGPVALSWGETQQLATPADEGQVYVSSRVVRLGGGLYRYEYNVMNVDNDRGINGISIPLPQGGNLSSVSFRQPRIKDPAFDARDWTNSIAPTGDALTYSAQPALAGTLNWTKPTQAMQDNSIRWGNMYSFWFTSDQAPRYNATMTLTPAGSGSVASMTATIPAPKSAADLNGDGTVDGGDFVDFINAFANGDILADIDGDGTVDGNDFVIFINAFAIG